MRKPALCRAATTDCGIVTQRVLDRQRHRRRSPSRNHSGCLAAAVLIQATEARRAEPQLPPVRARRLQSGAGNFLDTVEHHERNTAFARRADDGPRIGMPALRREAGGARQYR